MSKFPPFLSGMHDEDARWLHGAGEQRRVQAGEEIVRDGVPAQHLYVVLEGEFVTSLADDGAVRAATDGILLCIRHEDVAARAAGDPAFGTRFHQAISGQPPADEGKGAAPPPAFHVPDIIAKMLQGDLG